MMGMTDSFHTDSSFEKNYRKNMIKQLPLLKLPFSEFYSIEHTLHTFCKANKIRQSDEHSLNSSVIITIETEIIAHFSKQTIRMIQSHFEVNMLLRELLSENGDLP